MFKMFRRKSKKSIEELENESLESVRIELLKRFDDNDFIQYLYSKRRDRDIMDSNGGYTFTFKSHLIEFIHNDMKTNKIDNGKYSIMLDIIDFNKIFAMSYIDREELSWIKRNENSTLDMNKIQYEAKERAVVKYEEFIESRTHPYYRKICTNVDEIIRYRPDFEFYRFTIGSKLIINQKVKIPIVVKQQ